MAKKENVHIGLPYNEKVEVVRTKSGAKTVKKVMTVSDWLEMKKQPGYHYLAYQIGYSAYKTE